MRRFAIWVWSVVAPVLEIAFQAEARVSRAWVASAHHRLMLAQWKRQSQPEFFDHHIDLFYQFLATRNPLWVERGTFGALSIEHGSKILELACGDGFNARNFYSLKAGSVLACDFDRAAIATANRKNSAPNVTFVLADIRTAMPEGSFDNVVWDAAIEHFTPPEIEAIMASIKSRLHSGGVLSGYTIVEKADGTKHLHQHEYEFQGMEDLRRFLTPYFKHVTVFETKYPSRHNLYFWASDGMLPFRKEWSHAISESDPLDCSPLELSTPSGTG